MPKFDYLHKKQSGGAGQYGRVIGTLEPLTGEENTKLEFVDQTTGTDIPKQYVGAIKTGFINACSNGGRLTGQKVCGVIFKLKDGAHHAVDSSDWSFQQAADGAIRQAYESGHWILLEPVMLVETAVPSEFQASIISMLTKRSGIIANTESEDTYATIIAEVPLNDMFGFAGELRGLTEGKGEFTMEFMKYCPARAETTDKCIDEYEAKLEALQKETGTGKKKKRR